MGQVLLDGNYYEVKDGTIKRRTINPRAARFETGLPGYASFTAGSAQAWKGLRGGIGYKYHEGSGNEVCYFSNGVDCTHRGSIVHGPKVNTAGTFGKTPVKIIDFGGKTYAVGDDLIAEWNTSTSAWDSKETGISDPLDAIVVTDSTDSYLVVSNATAAKYTTDGSSWEELTGCYGYLAAHDNRLVGFYGQTLVYSPANDIGGEWDSCTVAGEDLGTVYGIFSAKSQLTDEPILCIHSTNGLFTFDFWVNQVYPYLRITGHSNGGRAGMYWNSYIFVSTVGGIKKIAGQLVTDIGPDQEDGLPRAYQGYVYDMCPAGDGSWMVFSVHNKGTSDMSSIFKRHGTIGGNQQVYTSTASPYAGITCVHYSPSHLYTHGRLWWGEGTNIKYCMFPDFNADVTQISDYAYVSSSGRLVFPIFAPLEAVAKTGFRVRATTKGCTSAKYWKVYYRTNANCFAQVDNSWTLLGTFDASPSPTALSFASGAGITFKQIQFAITGTTDSSKYTPELLSLEFDYDVPTVPISGWTFPVTVGKDTKDDILDNLYTSQAATTLLAFYPSGDSVHGDSHWVRIMNIAENVKWDMFRRHGTVLVTVEERFSG